MRPLPDLAATPLPPSPDLAATARRAEDLARAARATATQRAYRSDWAHFEAWCRAQGFSALPAAPTTIGLYLAAHETKLAMATLQRRLSTLASAHRLAGHQLDTRHPAISDVLRGLRRQKGTAQRHAEALTTPLLRRVLATCGERLIDLRDRALLLVGFAAALRRSELVFLSAGDVAVLPEGLRISIRRSKGDQEGAGQVLAVGRTGTPTCPAAALEAWLAAAEISEGRIFRSIDRHGRPGQALSCRAVALIVQARAAAAGLDAKTFSGHSMRAGFATTAAAAGLEERIIMRQTRHRSSAVVRRYIRDGELFARNLAAEVGL